MNKKNKMGGKNDEVHEKQYIPTPLDPNQEQSQKIWDIKELAMQTQEYKKRTGDPSCIKLLEAMFNKVDMETTYTFQPCQKGIVQSTNISDQSTKQLPNT